MYLAAMYSPLYFGLIDTDKTTALQHALWHFDTRMQLTDPSLAAIKWWRDAVHSPYNVVRHDQP